MSHESHSGPNCKYPTEKTARELLQRVRQFRREWARFAVRSQDVWNAFRSEGASLTEQFLDGLADLEVSKQLLLEGISHATAAVNEHDWECPTETASLQCAEERLSALVKFCQQRDARLRQQRQEHAGILHEFPHLRPNESALTDEWSKAIANAKMLAEEIESAEDCSEADLQRHTSPYRAFHILIQDALRRQAAPEVEESALDSGAEFSQITQAFREVTEQFGDTLALAALGGRIQVAAASWPVVATKGTAGDAGGRATQRQINGLVENFAGTPGVAAKSSTVRVPPSTAVRAAPPEVDFASLPDWADSLRQKSLCVKLQTGPDVGGRDTVAAAGYNNLATAIDTVVTILAARRGNRMLFRANLHEALRLLAEAQNAVRVHHQSGGFDTADVPEQTSIFHWLKDITDEDVEALPIERYMKLNDRADPLNHAKLAERLNLFLQKWNRVSRRADLLDAVVQAVTAFPEEETPRRWRRVDVAVSTFVDDGWKPNDAELREALLPLADEFGIADEQPDGQEFSDAFQAAMENVASFLDDQLSTELGRSVKSRQLPEHVLRVAALLRGKTVALIGGTSKPEARERIEAALQLKELIWIPASKQDRVSDLEPQVRNASLAILITALIGHKHNAMREACSRKGIPWVQMRKAAGYGVNQLADAILKQASNELAAASD